MMIRNLVIAFIVFILAVAFYSCIGKNVVSYKESVKYAEATKEKKDTLTIRFIALQSSILNISDYKVRILTKGKSKCYYVSLFWKGMGPNHNLKKGLVETPWGGIKLLIPVADFNTETDRVWYQDGSVKNEIKIGIVDTWRKLIEDRDRNSTVADSIKTRILSDPNF